MVPLWDGVICNKRVLTSHQPANTMIDDPYPHEFEGEITLRDVGTYTYTVVYLCPALARQLPFDGQPRLRFIGEVGEHPIEAAWQPAAGRWYAMLSKPLLREAGLTVGDRVRIRFRVAPADRVVLPDALSQALRLDDAARSAWQSLSPGKQRGLAYLIAAAKTDATLQKRLRDLLHGLKTAPDTLMKRPPRKPASRRSK
jgi:hypothetical protein